MKLTSKEIAFAGALAAFSAVTQLIHVGYRFPQWGMWLDIVAVSWLAAFFLFGRKLAFLVSLLGAIIITLFAPETWLGASMKWIATLPLWVILSFKQPQTYRQPIKLILPAVLALIVRIILILPLNYFYAIPIWTKMPPAVAFRVIPWYVIAGFNLIQGLIDIIFAWLLVFKFRLSLYARY